MEPNEKASVSSVGLNEITERKLQMDNTPTKNKFQENLFVTEQQKKILQTIHCCDCHHTRPLDGFRFKLMPLCSDCRTEREVEITGNRFERRRATK